MTTLIPERTTRYIAYAFDDASGEDAVPSEGRYRIDCRTTGRQVRAWTPISGVAASGQITLTSDDTAIIDRANAIEKRIVQVEASYGSDDKARQVIEFEVERLEGI